MSLEREYIENIKQVCEFLIENRSKVDFVVNCFYNQNVRCLIFSKLGIRLLKKSNLKTISDLFLANYMMKKK